MIGETFSVVAAGLVLGGPWLTRGVATGWQPALRGRSAGPAHVRIAYRAASRCGAPRGVLARAASLEAAYGVGWNEWADSGFDVLPRSNTPRDCRIVIRWIAVGEAIRHDEVDHVVRGDALKAAGGGQGRNHGKRRIHLRLGA